MGEVTTSPRESIMLCFVQGFHTREQSKFRRSKRSAGSIDARSAPTTPQYQISPTIECGQQSNQEKQQPQQHTTSGTQLTVNSNSSHLPPRSPSHISLQKCNDSQLSKPLSRSTPSMNASGGGIQTPIPISKSSTRSSITSTSSARQKKFHRHFSQVAPDERVLNYYSCALVGNMLLQGHLYITPNYFAFYSNVFGYVTKLLIPTTSVLKISKEKTARIIPNAIAIATEDERHVFGSLLSRDSTFKLMKQVWEAAIEGHKAADNSPLPVDVKLLTPEALVVDDSEVNLEEDDSSMSESGTDMSSRPPTICTDTDGMTPSISRPSLSSARLEHVMLSKNVSADRVGLIQSLLRYQFKPGTVIAILVALLAALYISAALMMVRIDKLHTAYLNHPFSSPEKFTQNHLMHYLNSNLDQIGKVRQSLQTLSQQFVAMNEENEARNSVPTSSGTVEPDDAPR
ncbi:hypothetical protein PV328_001990 [Microctonus aethiopoides]|uniref:GRAM domain-containing protein n=1 Tax=Microctonus aethiopoides TaxID=144406 RepID=A0AA39FYH7_9HYME|nr:hypothetical protein PV328_001990 [Microctonus aethiopoides]